MNINVNLGNKKEEKVEEKQNFTVTIDVKLLAYGLLGVAAFVGFLFGHHRGFLNALKYIR